MMKLFVTIALCCISINSIFAQDSNLDTLYRSRKNRNLTEQLNRKVDSIQQAFTRRSDSLRNEYNARINKMDSSHSKFQKKLDSLSAMKSSLTNAPQSRIDSLQAKMKSRIDSITIRLQSTRFSHALDSIRTLRDSTVAKLDRRIQTLKQNTIGKLNSLDLPPEVKSKVSTITGNIESFKLPASDLNIQSLNNSANLDVGKLNNVALSPNTDLKQVGGLENVKSKSELVPEVTGKTSGYSADIKQLNKGNLDEVKTLPKTAEEKATELSGMNEVKQQTETLDKYKKMAGGMKNPDSLKSFVKQEVKKAAVNHFAGKEEQLKKAMETIAKYKSKYSSLNSLADIKKRPPNAMKGKPFIERLVPGIAMQIQKKGDDFMVDFNPYAGYRFSGRITAGLGWNQRVAYNMDKKLFNPDARIFGPRIYGEFKLWKGFSPRLEGEVMNTKVPPATLTPSLDPGQREWVWGAFIGLKKEYRFYKNIKGTALIMTRVFNPDHKSPYADVLNVRFGFEFPTKKKNRQK